MKNVISIAFITFAFACHLRGQETHTPKVGSPERQAICDATREFIDTKYVEARTLSKPIVFKIGHFLVSGSYANFEVLPLFKDGSPAVGDYLPDIGYNFCLKNSGGVWRVVVDLSRSDVPDENEMAEIRRKLAEFPRKLLSPDWQRMLGR